jgi:hypothetical protein
MKSIAFELHSPLTVEECLGRFYALIEQNTHGTRNSRLDGAVYYDRIELWLRETQRSWKSQVLMGELYSSEQGTIFKGQVGLSISSRLFIVTLLMIVCLLIGVPSYVGLQKYWHGEELSPIFFIWPCFVLLGSFITVGRYLLGYTLPEKKELLELAQLAIDATPVTAPTLVTQSNSADQA